MTTITKNPTTINTVCYHCGESCEDNLILLIEKPFCCEGCKMVYEILNANDLCQFYDLEEKAGISLKGKKLEQYAYLDDEIIVAQLVNFSNEKISKATLHIPQIHCASCIWLLENLYKLNDGILASKVNFLKKEVYITFSNTATTFRKIVELLASIGYNPAINLSDLDAPKKQVVDKRFYYQLGIAGFAFGNIMLLSLPEYFGLTESTFREVFGYLNILLILPVVFYSGRDYLTSAWQGLRQQHLNIDVPISLGILTLFSRSIFEILTHTGAGYLDSLAGLVFFLLIGKWFQQATYHQLSFERDYKSYFPIAATVIKNGLETSVALSQLNIGDQIVLRHGELIPTDGILLKGTPRIDYSFVTGESEPVRKAIGEKLFAGGRQTGGTIQLTVTKKVAQSYLTQLWNEDTFQKEAKTTTSQLANKVGRYFTMVILTIAFATLAYWLPKDIPLAINAFTAVLIIACPCAVALSIPFTFGNAMRLMGRAGFYLKNTNVIERLNEISSIVFDKTGTITNAAESQLNYAGETLSEKEQLAVYALAKQSSHPISRGIVKYLESTQDMPNLNLFRKVFAQNFISERNAISPSGGGWGEEVLGNGRKATIYPPPSKTFLRPAKVSPALQRGKEIVLKTDISSNNKILEFQEKVGQGIEGIYNQFFIEIGKADKEGTFVKINGQQKGIFISKNSYRKGFQDLIKKWKPAYQLFLLSGDNDKERAILGKWLFKENLYFNQSPKDKLHFIKGRQQFGDKLLMLGDGLNDAGALQQADVGIVISENTNNFTPACDAILDARQFERLPDFIRYAQQSLKVVYAAYGLAFIYNVIGLSFAVQGTLSPVIAAILMPLSSVTIVAFGVGMTYLLNPSTETTRLTKINIS